MPPRIFTTTFQVRHYECDAYGHVNNAVYLRYMEESALRASADVGYPLERYQQMGYIWLTRDTDVQYLYPVQVGDRVEVKTWMTDLRRVRSVRQYEMRLAGTETLVAQAKTDWIYINTETEQPEQMPNDMVEAYYPGGDPPRLARTPFPEIPPQPGGGPYTVNRRVEWRDIDTLRHVNNAVYLTYMEDAAMQAVSHYGWTPSAQRQLGYGPVATHTRIEYLGPARLDDELVVSTWLYDVRGASGKRFYTIARQANGELLARAYTKWACVDLESGKPARIPAEFLADLKPHIAG